MKENISLKDIEKNLIAEIRRKLCKTFNKDFLKRIFSSENCFRCFWLKKLENSTKTKDTIWVNLEPEKRNNIRALSFFKNKFGVYFFLNGNKLAYIGSSSEGEHSLYARIQKQLNANDSNANFAENIRKIRGIKENLTKEKLKELILEESNILCVWSLVSKKEWDKISKYLILTVEAALIYSFNPPFNK